MNRLHLTVFALALAFSVHADTPASAEPSAVVENLGNNPKIRLLLLHGGPGATHELYECLDGYLPAAGIEYIGIGRAIAEGLAVTGDRASWEASLNVDVMGGVRLVEAVLPMMRDVGEGTILLVSSTSSIEAVPESAITQSRQGWPETTVQPCPSVPSRTRRTLAGIFPAASPSRRVVMSLPVDSGNPARVRS